MFRITNESNTVVSVASFNVDPSDFVDVEFLDSHLISMRNAGLISITQVGSATPISLVDPSAASPTLDAFARLRVSNPTTLFDSKQIHSNQPLFWDDQATAGTGTSSTHSAAKASTTLGVSSETAGTRVRQTFQRFNYQPGKSQLILMTFTLGTPATDITRRVGAFDANNGLYLEQTSAGFFMVKRSKVSGSVDNSRVAQADWNIDTLDGQGNSGLELNPANSQILIIDYEWLGVGRVRVGFVIDGIPYYCHQFGHSNHFVGVYMSTPNLPLRFELSNAGTGPAATLETICTSVMSEGGRQDGGILRSAITGAITSLATDTVYALIGIRLGSSYLDSMVSMQAASMIASSTNDQLSWRLYWNPTVAGVFTYSAQTNSAVEIATGAASNTITNGYLLDSGFLSTSQPASKQLENALRLGSTIAGTADTLVLAASPITNNITVRASLTWREMQ